MEPTEFGSIRKAAKATDISEGSIRDAKKNGKNFLKDADVKVFFIKWC